MEYKEKSVGPRIESAYHELTASEKIIADYFLSDIPRSQDLAAKATAARLAVSEATLSRFSKKVGFKGYREFIFQYRKNTDTASSANITHSTLQVMDAYQNLLSKSYSLISEEKISRIAKWMQDARRVFACGKGSSGFAADEMAYRFMRVGVDITAASDADRLKLLPIFRGEEDIVFGLSLSGTRREIVDLLKESRKQGAKTVMITANYHEFLTNICDEVLLVPNLEHLNYGNLISPQFPMLIMIDILYAAFMKQNRWEKETMHSHTLKALNHTPD